MNFTMAIPRILVWPFPEFRSLSIVHQAHKKKFEKFKPLEKKDAIVNVKKISDRARLHRQVFFLM